MENNILERVFGRDNRTYFMGWAIIIIMMYHIIHFYEEMGYGKFLPYHVFNNGWIGVDIFFLLSAFGLSASFEKNSILTFYKNRLKRLFPIYLLFLAFLFLLFFRTTISDFALMVIYNCTGYSLIDSTYYAEWYTPSLIILYAAFPVFYHLAALAKRGGIKLEILLLVVLVLIGFASTRYFQSMQLFLMRLPIIYFGILSYLHRNDGQWKKVFVYSAIFSLFVFQNVMSLSLILPVLLVAIVSVISTPPPYLSILA